MLLLSKTGLNSGRWAVHAQTIQRFSNIKFVNLFKLAFEKFQLLDSASIHRRQFDLET